MTTTVKEQIIETLDAEYELVYIEQGDQLTTKQVEFIVAGDYESLDETIEDWLGENTAIGARAAAVEAVAEFERYNAVPEDFDPDEAAWEIEEVIRDRDTSHPLRDLANATPDPLLRVQVIGEESRFTAHGQASAADYLREIGLSTMTKNAWAMDNLMASTPSEVHMAYVVFPADTAALLDTMGDPEATVTVTDPHIVMGNPFTGAYSEAVFRGQTLTFRRGDLATDEGAFGYSVTETYGKGLISESASTIAATAKEA